MPVLGSPVESTWAGNDTNPVTLDNGELRRADSTMFAGAGVALGARGGIVRHGDLSLAVTVDGSDAVTVQPGACVLPGNATGVGVYRTALPAAVTGTLPVRDSTNSRIDLVVFHQLDTDVVTSSAGYRAQVETITGTPSATPGVPALPSQAVELARITVPPVGGGTAVVDATFRPYATAVGGTIPVASSTQLPAAAAKGQRAIALDTLVEYVWNGTIWQSGGSGERAAAAVSFPAVGPGANATKDITFPAGRFSTAPHVFLSSGRTRLSLAPINVTAAGFTINADNYTNINSPATTVDYFASPTI